MRASKSIRQNIARQMLQTSLIAISLVFVIAVVGIVFLRQSAVNISHTLGNSAASDSKHALEVQTIEMLQSLAQGKAQLSDEVLDKIQSFVLMAADNAEDIAVNPHKYKEDEIAFPTLDDLGKITTYVQLPERVALTDVEPELGLLANNQNMFKHIFHNNTEITSVYMGTESGICITIDEVTEPVTSVFDPRERPWYKSAKSAGAGNAIWTDVFDDAFGRGLAIACAEAYGDTSGNISGVVGLGFTLSGINDLVLGTKMGESGYSFIINENGQMIMSPTIERDENGQIIRENLLESENETLRLAAEKMLSSKSGVEKVIIDGIEYCLAYDSIHTVQWKFVTLISADEAIKMATESEKNILKLKNEAIHNIDYWVLVLSAVFIVVLCVIVVIIVYLSRHMAARLTNPISELMDGAKIISAGNLDHKFNIETDDEIQTLSETFAKMIDNIKKITSEKERIGAELNVATKIQASMLPCIFPAFPERKEFDIYATMLPAKEVGGDFYDFFMIDDDHLVLVIADVSGKGVPAALFMVIAKTLIKNNAQYGKSPKEVFETVNDMLCENNDANMFVTAFMGYLEISTGKFIYVNAGHNPPIIQRKDGKCEWLPTKPGFVLAGISDMFYKQYEITLHGGDLIYMYTDGVTEAVNEQYDLFSDAKLLEVCNQYGDCALRELLVSIKKDIDKFAGQAEQADDITMLAFRISERS